MSGSVIYGVHMKNILLIIGAIATFNCNAIVVDGGIIAEANLVAAHAAGMSVYNSCILIPPVTKPQIAICEGLQRSYYATLVSANAPLPLIINPYPSPYSWSPYDICRYEPSVLIFPAEGGTPICPSI